MFQGRNWDFGRAKELRNFFTYRIDEKIHRELHNHVLSDVPVPNPMEMSRLYERFREDRWRLENYDMLEALDWLQRNCESQPFNEAIQKQIDFFSAKLPKAG